MGKIMLMNKSQRIVQYLFLVSFTSLLFVQPVFSQTYSFTPLINKRNIKIVRNYKIKVVKGQKTTVALPALMSFWGATNEQIIQTSHFKYSVEPDEQQVHSDDRGMPRKYHKLTWNNPQSDVINVEQVMTAKLVCRGRLFTKATLPYSEDIQNQFNESLKTTKKIKPDDSRIEPICSQILKKSRSAEQAVQQTCDWINDNIKFLSGARDSSDVISKKRRGNCSGMSYLACAMLRKMGIPAEVVKGKFIGSDSGHVFIEVYYPDAGWVFYDLSNHERGVKTLDCLITVGWAYWKKNSQKFEWVDGYFCREKDMRTFRAVKPNKSRPIRKTPRKIKVCGSLVFRKDAPKSVKSRHKSIRQLIMDSSIPSEVREFTPKEVDNKE